MPRRTEPATSTLSRLVRGSIINQRGLPPAPSRRAAFSGRTKEGGERRRQQREKG